MKIIERVHNIETGESTEVEKELSPQEIASIQKVNAILDEEIKKEAKAKEQRGALLQKLGLTEDEAKLLLS